MAAFELPLVTVIISKPFKIGMYIASISDLVIARKSIQLEDLYVYFVDVSDVETGTRHYLDRVL